MSIRRVVAAALTALLMLCVLAAAGAQPKVRFVLKDLDTDPNAEKFIAMIEEGMAKAGTPVDLELLKVPSANYAEKIGLMVVSGDIPDLIYFQGGDEKLAQQGVLEDLTPYVAKSKYLKALMDAHSATRLASYPYIVWLSPPRVRVPVMRKDWFNSLVSAQMVQKSPSVDYYYSLFKDLVAKKGAKYGSCVTGATNGV